MISIRNKSELIVILIICAKTLFADIKLFIENSERKALIYPNKTLPSVSRLDAINICYRNNATLVDIESEEKQTIVINYLNDINRLDTSAYRYYWLSGYNASGKYKWLNSGNEFKYTNWAFNPISSDSFVRIYSYYGDTYNGHWLSAISSDDNNVFCEMTFNMSVVVV